jgi:hypothetical protein
MPDVRMHPLSGIGAAFGGGESACCPPLVSFVHGV